MDLSYNAYDHCELCPRRCKAARDDGRPGACGATSTLRVARGALHFWEEPPISGEAGSGAIFFCGCPLRCVFCQNHEISHDDAGKGVAIDADRLATTMLDLQDQGALNINLVTALHYAPHVCDAVVRARQRGLGIPVLCNTSGYERASLVRALDGIVDVWLTDFKYASPTLAARLSAARDYPQVASAALAQMLRQTRNQGGRLLDSAGAMQRGIVVRHLVLPGHVDDTCAVLDRVWELCGDEVDISLMNQYTPNEFCRQRGGELSRGVGEDEYEIALCHADDLGFSNIWWQQGGTVSESFVPSFDGTGVR